MSGTVQIRAVESPELELIMRDVDNWNYPDARRL
jgi:hypothetical protein